MNCHISIRMKNPVLLSSIPKQLLEAYFQRHIVVSLYYRT